MTKYPFLSDAWIEESRKIHQEFRGRTPEITVSIRLNQIINDVPFGEGVIQAHVDTSPGELEIDTGHLENPDATLTLNYDTAKAILVDADTQAAMNAFLSGRIKIDGDITKMLSLQTTLAAMANDNHAVEMVKRIQQMTA